MGTVNDRGRVPFALIGVLLLLTSTTLAATVSMDDHGRESPDIDRAMDGATAVAMTELRGAVDAAATNASAAPVTRPADTTAGRALNDTKPFRDALRLRIYLRAVERLEGTETTHGETTVRVSLPPVESTQRGYRNAIERVEIERAGEDDAALGVEIEGVMLSAIRDGETVETTTRSPSLVVANPALLLHDRTERFEARSNAPVTRGGFGRRLTARLYPIAWTRGYAQYGGAPIATVLGTRHVELAANDALLAEQRTVFGEADRDGDRGVAAAGRRVATTDMIAGVGGDEEWQDAVLRSADEIGPDPPADQPVGTWRDEPDDPTVTVGVNASADHAFADLVGIAGDDELGEIIERAHTVEARTKTRTSLRDRTRRHERSPGGNWTFRSVDTSQSTSVTRAHGRVPQSAGWRTWDGAVRDVTVTQTKTRRWRNGNRTTTTKTVRERTYRVRIAVQARTKPIEGVPQGRLGGHLRSATDGAVDDARSDGGGFRNIAKDAAHDRSTRGRGTQTTRPAIDRDSVESALRSTRESTRDVSVTIPATAVGTGRANPPRQLRGELSEEAFLTQSRRTPIGRTLRASRIGYLDTLDAELRERESVDDHTGDGIADALGKHLNGDRLDGALAAHRRDDRPDPAPIADPAGNLSVAVDTAPSYLTTSEVTGERIDEPDIGRVHPLKTRTVNVFTSPHDDVASGILDRIPVLDTERVSLSIAARTLAATDDGEDRDRLEREVQDSTAHVRGELLAEMVDAGVHEREAQRLLEPDVSTAEEALMLANGSTIERASKADSSVVSADRLGLRLRTTLDTALEDERARPPAEPTETVQQRARSEYGDALEDTLADGLESKSERERSRALGKRLGSLPAGLPIAPVPGYWYATANVWYVDLAGSYERFAVRANRGGAAGSVTYLRDGRAAPVSHRGETLHLGTSEKVSFRTQTAVVVVVPPGPRGVGNTDGTWDERSSGWPP